MSKQETMQEIQRDWLVRNIPSIKQAIINNEIKQTELVEGSKKNQTEFDELTKTNTYLKQLLAANETLSTKVEGETDERKENV